jgi:OOP family OmpA-OmpF porin
VTLLVFFGFNNAMLSAESYPELDRVAKLLKDQPTVQIEIAGHTDGEGTEEYNQSLSERRALAVKNYLVLQGISGSRLTPAGYGKTKPIADNDDEEGRAQNRRVEMVIKASQDLGKK